MQEFKGTGIVIAAFDARESDLVLRLASSAYGKLAVIARGAKRSKKRFGAPPDLFDRGVFEATLSRGQLANLKGFTHERSFKNLRSSLEKICAASLCCEVYDVLVPEGTGDHDLALFNILDRALRCIDEESDNQYDSLLCEFLSASLEASGFTPPGVISEETSPKLLKQLLSEMEHVTEKPLKTRQQLLDIL